MILEIIMDVVNIMYKWVMYITLYIFALYENIIIYFFYYYYVEPGSKEPKSV